MDQMSDLESLTRSKVSYIRSYAWMYLEPEKISASTQQPATKSALGFSYSSCASHPNNVRLEQ